jgi:hypothetical protein
MLQRQNNTNEGRAMEKVLCVSGRVEAPLDVDIDLLRSMDQLQLEDLPMTCGSGEPKGRVGRCRGVLLADILNRAQVIVADHNDTKKMYVVAASGDGYKTVFSWQEIFNSANGEGIVVLLEKDGKSLYNDPVGVDLISSRDHLSGPRYVKRLQDIEIIMID